MRKLHVVVETVYEEAGQSLAKPVRRAVAAAVIHNPLAGSYTENLEPLVEIGEKLGELLGTEAVKALGCAPEDVHSYGKAAIVGSAGEREHAAALLHPRLGKGVRANTAGGKAIIPSTKKIGAPGVSIAVPLQHKDDDRDPDHWDAVEIQVPEAPLPNEVVVAVAVTDGPRSLPRIRRFMG